MSELSLTIKKHLGATPEEVFDAWTTPAHMEGWLSPMTTASVPVCDLRVGGEFQIDMHGEGKTYMHKGKYLEIDRPRRLVFTWISEGTQRQETVVTLELEADSGGTALTLTHDRFPTAESTEQHRQGWGAILDKLEGVFPGEARASG